ncbi:MAG TPA: 50S ribosomal protein L20 [Planctomycetota bacterium]|nr:50S ribosomal protein L20 [Planctomycetota bacterium]
MRTKTNVARHKYQKRILRKAKGYVGGRRKMFRTAAETIDRAEAYNTKHRKTRRGDFRKLWITRLNAAARDRGLRYGELIHALKLAKIELNRKMLSELAINDVAAFDAVFNQAKAALKK